MKLIELVFDTFVIVGIFTVLVGVVAAGFIANDIARIKGIKRSLPNGK